MLPAHILIKLILICHWFLFFYHILSKCFSFHFGLSQAFYYYLSCFVSKSMSWLIYTNSSRLPDLTLFIRTGAMTLVCYVAAFEPSSGLYVSLMDERVLNVLYFPSSLRIPLGFSQCGECRFLIYSFSEDFWRILHLRFFTGTSFWRSRCRHCSFLFEHII